MRAVAIGVLLLAAGCAPRDPREDARLFEDAGERARRDLCAVYYAETNDGALHSIVIPRSGAPQVRWEVSPQTIAILGTFGESLRRRGEEEGSVDAPQRDAIDAFFAGLPAGASERTLSPEPTLVQAGFEEVERVPPTPTRVRILHVSKSGETKTLTLFKASPQSLPAGVQAGGAAVQTIDELFLRIGNPMAGERRSLWKSSSP